MNAKINLAIALETYLAAVCDGTTEGHVDIDELVGRLYITVILSDPEIGKAVGNHCGALAMAQNLANN